MFGLVGSPLEFWVGGWCILFLGWVVDHYVWRVLESLPSTERVTHSILQSDLSVSACQDDYLHKRTQHSTFLGLPSFQWPAQLMDRPNYNNFNITTSTLPNYYLGSVEHSHSSHGQPSLWTHLTLP